jgi:muramoyltetrapeptide carboxypeptidase
MLIRPRHLSPGDTIGIVAPASAPPEPKAIDRGVAVLENLGFKCKLAPNVRQRNGYLAGTARQRAGDVMRMFADRRVNAIICVRGGYGTARLLPLLDYRVIRANAKIFVGYSDITSLHCAFLTKANLISFHGPMLNSDFVHEDMPAFTLQSFLRMLGVSTGTNRHTTPAPAKMAGATQSEIAPHGGIAHGYRRKTIQVLHGGRSQGQLIGGNLALLCTHVGTPWQPDFRGRIVFFEDVGELPYRFDRMLTYLMNCGLLQQVAGIAVGLNADCEDPKAKGSKEYRQSLMDVLKERLLPLKVPVIAGLPFGHVPCNATLPIGVNATLDAEAGELVIAEPAVA